MKTINIVKYALDLVMGFTFVLLFDTHASGMTVHEIAGLFMGGAYFTHIALNWRWVRKVTLQLFDRRLKGKVRLGYLLNTLLLVFMTITVGTGILTSRVVLPALNREDIAWFRIAHLTLPFILLILIGAHIGLHWNWVVHMTKRLLKRRQSYAWGRPAAWIAVALILVYGVYAGYTYRFVERVKASAAVVGIPYEGELRGELMGKADDAAKEGYDPAHYGNGEEAVPGGTGSHPGKGVDEGKGSPVNGIGGGENKEGTDGAGVWGGDQAGTAHRTDTGPRGDDGAETTVIGANGGGEGHEEENKGESEGGLAKAISMFFGLLAVFIVPTYYADKWWTGRSGGSALAEQDTLPVPESNGKKDILVLWASQSGHAERAAAACGNALSRAGYRTNVKGMHDFPVADIPAQRRVLLIASTFGDGEPPDNGAGFWRELGAVDAPRLNGVGYAVLALGDSNYVQFCEFGRKLDARFAQLGAERLLPIVECDGEYAGPATDWIGRVIECLGGLAGRSGGISPEAQAAPTGPAPAAVSQVRPGYSRSHPVPARLIVNRRLNGEQSAKDTRHYEFDLSASELQYEPGDALGVWPTNSPELAKQLLAAVGLSGEERVTVGEYGEKTLFEALMNDWEITRISPDLVKLVQMRTNDPTLDRLLRSENRTELASWMNERHTIDLLTELRVPLSAEQLAGSLKPLQPRLYSISSSPRANPGTVHITVSTVRFKRNGEMRHGACSVFLADRVRIGEEVPVFIHSSPHFRLPANPDTPIIMIGARTGVAPFRAFLQERQALQAKGRNWLIFGEQHSKCDFYYKDELEALRKAGYLHRLDLAFSRDQEEKIYVQHRMKEAGAELWAWLEQGAYFYVCGDAGRMAKEVNDALKEIVRLHGRMCEEQSEAYVQGLIRDKRYMRDVY